MVRAPSGESSRSAPAYAGSTLIPSRGASIDAEPKPSFGWSIGSARTFCPTVVRSTGVDSRGPRLRAPAHERIWMRSCIPPSATHSPSEFDWKPERGRRSCSSKERFLRHRLTSTGTRSTRFFGSMPHPVCGKDDLRRAGVKLRPIDCAAWSRRPERFGFPRMPASRKSPSAFGGSSRRSRRPGPRAQDAHVVPAIRATPHVRFLRASSR